MILTEHFWQSSASHIWQNPRAPIPTPNVSQLPTGTLLFATSGTAGQPKWVALSREQLLASARAANAWLGATAQDKWARALPEFHVGGISIHARSFLLGKCATIFPTPWNATAFHRFIQNENITLTSLVPTQAHDLLRAKLTSPPGLRAVILGGGALPQNALDQLRHLGWPLLPSFGMTEAASQIATAKSPRTDSLLEVLPHWEAAQDAEDHLLIRGPALFSGYWIKRDAWQFISPISEDGWFTTPDLVKLHARHLTWLGRADRTVKVLGELVNLDSIEATLPADSCYLETLPDERLGARLRLVAAGDEARWREVLAAYNSRAAPFARIADLRIVQQLPRTPLGKIKRV